MEMTVTEKDDEITEKKRRNFFLLSPTNLLMSFIPALASPVLTDLIVYKTCLVSLKFNETECLMLRNNSSSPEASSLETQVEPYASVIIMINNLSEDLLPAMFCLFLGPWSDRGGRRPPLLVAMSGITLMFFTLSIIADWIISPWYLLAAAIPANIVGSMWTVRLIIICYVSDTTKGEGRMLQMALLEVCFNGGLILGGLTGPLIYENYGYANVFRAAAICAGLSLIYTFFFISETVKNSSKESLRSFFKISLVKDLAKSSFRKRKGFDRFIVWLAFVVIGIDSLTQRGDWTTQFLFTRARLGWDVQRYSYFFAIYFVLRLTGLSLLFFRRFCSKIPDTIFAAISNLSSLGYALTRSLAWKSWHMYLGSSIAALSSIAVPVSQTVIMRFVPAKDVGKVFSIVSLIEILSSLAGPSLYTLFYSNYLPPIYPSPVHMLSFFIYVLSIVCVIFIHLRIRKCEKQGTYVVAPQEDLET